MLIINSIIFLNLSINEFHILIKYYYQFCFVLLIITLCLNLNTYGQDAQLSQYYAAPLYLNPALVGSGGDGRANINYRNQWTGVPSNYMTFIGGFDTPLANKRLSIGGQIQQDIMAQNSGAILDRTVVNVTGGYKLKVSKEYTLSFGLQMGFEQSSLGFYNLLFGDQIDDDGVTGNPTQDRVDRESIIYPDFSAGTMLYGKGYWLGVSFYHINQPTISRFNNGNDYLPLRYSLQAGYRLPLSYKWHGSVANYDDKYLSFMLHYQSQGKNDQLSVGANFDYHPIIFGVWYRGLLLKENEDPNQFNHDAITVMSGVKLKRLTLGYSFDIPIGGLQFSEGNSHELSLTYNFNFYPDYRRKKKKSKMGVPTDECPVPNL